MDLSQFLFNTINEFFSVDRTKNKELILKEFEDFIREKFQNELEKMDYEFFL